MGLRPFINISVLSVRGLSLDVRIRRLQTSDSDSDSDETSEELKKYVMRSANVTKDLEEWKLKIK